MYCRHSTYEIRNIEDKIDRLKDLINRIDISIKDNFKKPKIINEINFKNGMDKSHNRKH
jgi:cell division protein FtsL